MTIKNTNSKENLSRISSENYQSALIFINRFFLALTFIALICIMKFSHSSLSAFAEREIKVAFIVVASSNVLFLMAQRTRNRISTVSEKLLGYMIITAGIGYMTCFSQVLKSSI